MKAADIEPILAAWVARHKDLEAQLEVLYESLHADPGSPLIEAIYRLMDAHTHAIARIVGDTEGWLSWYEHETDFGASAAHSAMIGDKAVKVRTIKQLARVVAAR
ncbi:MAG: hypothetical protein AB1720_02470 [Pseudomonadota bacterium]